MWDWLKSKARRQQEAQRRFDEQERNRVRPVEEQGDGPHLHFATQFASGGYVQTGQSATVGHLRPVPEDQEEYRAAQDARAGDQIEAYAEQINSQAEVEAYHQRLQERHDAIDAISHRLEPIPHVGGELRAAESVETDDQEAEVIERATGGFTRAAEHGSVPRPEHADWNNPERIQEAVEAIQEAAAVPAEQRWEDAPQKPGESRVSDLEGTEWRIWPEDGMVKIAWDGGRSQAQFTGPVSEHFADALDHAYDVMEAAKPCVRESLPPDGR